MVIFALLTIFGNMHRPCKQYIFSYIFIQNLYERFHHLVLTVIKPVRTNQSTIHQQWYLSKKFYSSWYGLQIGQELFIWKYTMALMWREVGYNAKTNGEARRNVKSTQSFSHIHMNLYTLKDTTHYCQTSRLQTFEVQKSGH